MLRRAGQGANVPLLDTINLYVNPPDPGDGEYEP